MSPESSPRAPEVSVVPSEPSPPSRSPEVGSTLVASASSEASGSHAEVGPPSDPGSFDDVDLHQLLRATLGASDEPAPPRLLPNIQARLREGSQGRFFGDGWSRVRAPRTLFLGTCALMMVIALVCVLLLRPTLVAPLGSPRLGAGATGPA